jgi:hypothetical protein
VPEVLPLQLLEFAPFKEYPLPTVPIIAAPA